jgi:hypothetical protein
MSLPSDSGSASLGDTQKDAPVGESSQPASIENVRVEDDKTEGGKQKKKKKRGNKRSTAAKKRGTGFEGKSRFNDGSRRCGFGPESFTSAYTC